MFGSAVSIWTNDGGGDSAGSWLSAPAASTFVDPVTHACPLLFCMISSSSSPGLLLVHEKGTPFPGLGHLLPLEFVIERNVFLSGDTVEEQCLKD